MDPDSKTPNMQGVYGPTPPGVQPPDMQPVEPLKSGKRKFVLVGVITVALAGAIMLLIALPRGQKKTPQQAQDDETTTETQGPQPATAITTEQANNAISQEIGNLNDDHDFPADQLSDENLEL